MNEVGILGKFMPDFDRIVAMMQYDMYHSYTVDEHTIFAMGILHQIETGTLKDIAPVATEAVKEIYGRDELHVAMLLHDIAKGRGGDHSILGAEVARQVCPRLGLGMASTETIAWLIRHHLLMSETAFRYDLNDPATITHFGSAVQSPERLNLLLVLTVADIRAVGPNVWNGWKAALMRDLYHRTMAVLLGADASIVAENMAGAMHKELVMALMADDSGWDQDSAQHHINMFYPNYWTSFDLQSYIHHAKMCRQFDETNDLVGISMTPDQSRNATEIAIITADDVGLFARIAGGVAACGANIVDARITTRKDGLTLDVLWVQDQNYQAITEKAKLNKMKTALKKAMTGQMDIDHAMETRWQQTPQRIRRISAPARVLINNHISPTHSIIEINGKDAPGLLYRITHALAGLGIQIQLASVSTYGDRVVDVFYVKDSFGLKIERQSRMDNIRETLLKVLEDSDPANQVAA
jgi:[protein-PII] uridylyltransferase